MAQFEFVEWLVRWLIEKIEFKFDWDEGNSTKSLVKHGIDIEKAEQVFINKDLLVPLGIQTSPLVIEPRFGALGMDFKGNRLALAFTIREGKIRIISVRPMSLSERKQYAEIYKK
jgi:uncharacterized protein